MFSGKPSRYPIMPSPCENQRQPGRTVDHNPLGCAYFCPWRYHRLIPRAPRKRASVISIICSEPWDLRPRHLTIPSILRPAMSGTSHIVNIDISILRTFNLRPHYFGWMGSLKMQGPLYKQCEKITCTQEHASISAVMKIRLIQFTLAIQCICKKQRGVY